MDHNNDTDSLNDRTIQTMRIGPARSVAYWETQDVPGDCPHCGGQCDPDQDCGIHPLGCFFGGGAEPYWLIAEGCTLFHGEPKE